MGSMRAGAKEEANAHVFAPGPVSASTGQYDFSIIEYRDKRQRSPFGAQVGGMPVRTYSASTTLVYLTI